MSKYILTVTLNPAVDKTIRVNQKKVLLSAGGKGLNVSRALKSLGEATLATGFLGGAAGKFIKRELNKERIPHDFSRIKGQTRTNLTVIDPSRKITRALERGPHITFTEIKAFKKKFASLLQKSRFVVFSGSLPPGVPASIYKELILMAEKAHVSTCVDTSGRALKLALPARPFLVKPNSTEGEEVLGYRLNSDAKLKKAIRDFANFGARQAIISLGERGAVTSDGREIFLVVPPPLKTENNVGCGDALVGGFIHTLNKCLEWKERLRFAVAVAAANTFTLKPGEIQKRRIKKLMKGIKIKTL